MRVGTSFRRLLLLIFLLFIPDNQAGAQAESAGRVLDQAIKAAGGSKLSKIKALHWSGQATVHADGRKISIEGQWYLRPPDMARVVTHTVGSTDMRTLVLNGPKGWTKRGDGEAQTMERNFFEEEREQFYLYWLAQLAPLKQPDFRLELLGEKLAGTHRSVVLLVSHLNYRDVRLFFDQQSHRLIKQETRRGAGANEVSQESFLDDFKASNGVWWPRHLVILREGRPYFELTITELELLPAVDERLFNRP